ncbi:uncharacterized protein FIBRA_00526 [Fibroporia radiculosa]|uniref:Uncharacterized protein n=1 Tax=Fibroporia radiculosa TaxID=599839 RepID=J4HRR7_9APHY|nr:uncharacterized protein FIBRA_00526 [Fibroporia radiculosa]CCL98527.1 predicted protein [Fibroporia radiculosa]
MDPNAMNPNHFSIASGLWRQLASAHVPCQPKDASSGISGNNSSLRRGHPSFSHTSRRQRPQSLLSGRLERKTRGISRLISESIHPSDVQNTARPRAMHVPMEEPSRSSNYHTPSSSDDRRDRAETIMAGSIVATPKDSTSTIENKSSSDTDTSQPYIPACDSHISVRNGSSTMILADSPGDARHLPPTNAPHLEDAMMMDIEVISCSEPENSRQTEAQVDELAREDSVSIKAKNCHENEKTRVAASNCANLLDISPAVAIKQPNANTEQAAKKSVAKVSKFRNSAKVKSSSSESKCKKTIRDRPNAYMLWADIDTTKSNTSRLFPLQAEAEQFLADLMSSLHRRTYVHAEGGSEGDSQDHEASHLTPVLDPHDEGEGVELVDEDNMMQVDMTIVDRTTVNVVLVPVDGPQDGGSGFAQLWSPLVAFPLNQPAFQWQYDSSPPSQLSEHVWGDDEPMMVDEVYLGCEEQLVGGPSADIYVADHIARAKPVDEFEQPNKGIALSPTAVPFPQTLPTDEAERGASVSVSAAQGCPIRGVPYSPRYVHGSSKSTGVLSNEGTFAGGSGCPETLREIREWRRVQRDIITRRREYNTELVELTKLGMNTLGEMFFMQIPFGTTKSPRHSASEFDGNPGVSSLPEKLPVCWDLLKKSAGQAVPFNNTER